MPRSAARKPQLGIRQLLTVPHALPGPLDLGGGHHARAAVPGQEPDVLQHRRIRARTTPRTPSHAVRPARPARPVPRRSSGPAAAPAGLTFTSRAVPGRRHQQEVRHMMPDPAADRGPQDGTAGRRSAAPAGRSRPAAAWPAPAGSHRAQPARRRRGIRPRVMGLPAANAPEPPPRNRPGEIRQPQPPSGTPALTRRRTGPRQPDRRPSRGPDCALKPSSNASCTRSHCAGIPDFARTVLMIIRNCALRPGSYRSWWRAGGAEERGGGLAGLGAGGDAELGEPCFQQAQGAADRARGGPPRLAGA